MGGRTDDTVRLGIIGTSWWADAMYLPALTNLDVAAVVAIAGRDPERTRARASQWGVPGVHTDWEEMLAVEQLDGLVVAAANPVHAPATRAGLQAGLHVLCEKPVARSYAEAAELASLAEDRGAITLVPFTYAYMPGFCYLEHLVDEGYVGTIHHVGLRYHTGYAIDADYLWKLDARRNPTGALGDLGSHFVYLAIRLAGPISAVTARLQTVAAHPRRDDTGAPYPQAPDTAAAILEFASGAQGVLHASAVAHEGTSMDQRHAIEVHGSRGTLRYVVDWDTLQQVSGARVGEGPVRTLTIPDEFWQGARRERVHDTYRDVFRTTPAMSRGWASAIAEGRPVRPDLRDGAAVQRVLEACAAASRDAVRIELGAGDDSE